MKLTGQRNQCRACGKYFNSNAAFTKHRLDFKCLTTEQMEAKGMSQNKAGYWITAINKIWS